MRCVYLTQLSRREARSSSRDAGNATGSGVEPECGWSSQPPRFFFFLFFIRILAGSMFVAITLQIVHVPDVIVCLAGCNSGGGGRKLQISVRESTKHLEMRFGERAF